MALEATQSQDLDVTGWLLWFVRCLIAAVVHGGECLVALRNKERWWQRWAGFDFNDRQWDIVNRLLDGFEGNFTASKWARIAKCPQDTALRDINGLVDMGVLLGSPAGGRSTKYALLADHASVSLGSWRSRCSRSPVQAGLGGRPDGGSAVLGAASPAVPRSGGVVAAIAFRIGARSGTPRFSFRRARRV